MLFIGAACTQIVDVGGYGGVNDAGIADTDVIPEPCSETSEQCKCTIYSQRNNRYWPPEMGPEPFVQVINGVSGRLYTPCQHAAQVCRIFPEEERSEWGIWEDGLDHIGGTDDDVWVPGGFAGGVFPETDICDNVDNDCDGRTDESLKKPCWSRDPEFYTFNSPEHPDTPCRLGVQECRDGRWTNCEHETLPSSEICDAVDNDCDGVVDNHPEGDGDTCGLTDTGQCQYGALECDLSVLDMMCVGYQNPSDETCNDRDDDCNGSVDEGLFRPCQSICGSGFETCQGGDWGACTANEPMEEICDAVDNDCDGLIDEGLECPCPPELEGALIPCIGGNVICGGGFQTCLRQGEDLVMTECCVVSSFLRQGPFVCDGGEGSIQPEICNAYDDDCDGLIDEELVDSCYSGPQNTINVGQCHPGEVICDSGRWGNFTEGIFLEDLCLEETLPEEEVCNFLDDDCDGLTDEDLNAHERVDMIFLLDSSGSMCSRVQALKGGISPYIMSFAQTPHRFGIGNIPGAGGNNDPPDIRIDLTTAENFWANLAAWQCTNAGDEPQYDAVESTASGAMGFSFRDDAFPMIIMMTDEGAQSNRGLAAADVRAALSPCQVGDCGAVDTLEVYAIVPRAHDTEWCAPADIAKQCYDLYPGIDGPAINRYLEEIFHDICR